MPRLNPLTDRKMEVQRDEIIHPGSQTGRAGTWRSSFCSLFSHSGLSSCFPSLVPVVSFKWTGFPTFLSEAGPRQLVHYTVKGPSHLLTHLGNTSLWADLESSLHFLQSIVNEPLTSRTEVIMICCSEAFLVLVYPLHSWLFKCLITAGSRASTEDTACNKHHTHTEWKAASG